MKILPIAAVLVAGGAWLGSGFYAGKMLEKGYAEIAAKNPQLKTTFERGFLSSKVTWTLVIGDHCNPTPDMPSVVYTGTIRQGWLLSGFTSLAKETGEIRIPALKIKDNPALVTLSQGYGLLGGFSGEAKATGFKHVEDDTSFDVLPFTATYSGNLSRKTIDYQGDWAGMAIASTVEKKKVVIGKLTFSGDGREVMEGVGVGKGTLALADIIGSEMPNDQKFSLKGLKVDFATEESGKGLLKSALDLQWSTINIADKPLQALRFNVVLDQLDAAGLNGIVKATNACPLDATAVQKALFALAGKPLSLNLKEASAQTKDGKVTGNLRITFAGIPGFSEEKAAELPSKIKVEANIALPVALVGEAQASPEFQGFLDQKRLVLKDKTLSSQLTFDGQTLKINGEALSPEDQAAMAGFLGMMMGGDPEQ